MVMNDSTRLPMQVKLFNLMSDEDLDLKIIILDILLRRLMIIPIEQIKTFININQITK